jgi:hypothetical protein
MSREPDVQRIESAEEVVHGMGLRRFARRDYAKVRSYLDVLEDLEAKLGRMMLEDGADEDADGDADEEPEKVDAPPVDVEPAPVDDEEAEARRAEEAWARAQAAQAQTQPELLRDQPDAGGEPDLPPPPAPPVPAEPLDKKVRPSAPPRRPR